MPKVFSAVYRFTVLLTPAHLFELALPVLELLDDSDSQLMFVAPVGVPGESVRSCVR